MALRVLDSGRGGAFKSTGQSDFKLKERFDKGPGSPAGHRYSGALSAQQRSHKEHTRYHYYPKTSINSFYTNQNTAVQSHALGHDCLNVRPALKQTQQNGRSEKTLNIIYKVNSLNANKGVLGYQPSIRIFFGGRMSECSMDLLVSCSSSARIRYASSPSFPLRGVGTIRDEGGDGGEGRKELGGRFPGFLIASAPTPPPLRSLT